MRMAIALALLIPLLAGCEQGQASGFGDGGRFHGVTSAGQDVIYIVDSETGAVRVCGLANPNTPNMKFVCSAVATNL